MQRLLQGEVGSGKTVVALRAMLAVVDAGGQAALLAPTEVLAQQHQRSITALLGALGRAAGCSAAPTTAPGSRCSPGRWARRRGARRCSTRSSGEAGIVIGTHALLEERVQFLDLGLVVVDEQHRFGVEQRAALAPRPTQRPARPGDDGNADPADGGDDGVRRPGDVDADRAARGPGRRSRPTSSPTRDSRAGSSRAWQRIREEVAAGRQAYVVCARIGERRAAPTGDGAERRGGRHRRRPQTGRGRPRPGPRAGRRAAARDSGVEVLHGQLAPETKDASMRRFAEGEIDVLVATTVVEVGVDVPNATVMVVMDADRFGVCQLHQLRGRIGRGGERSFCLLVTDMQAGPARVRLDAVAGTLDGFALSEVDLRAATRGRCSRQAQSGRPQVAAAAVGAGRRRRDRGGARARPRSLVDRGPRAPGGQPALLAEVDAMTADERADYLERS